MISTLRRSLSGTRLARFGSVGVVATLVHSGVLALLQAGFDRPRGEANLMGFLVAFVVSMSGQQRFTFQDRLQGRRLNGLGLMILLAINAAAAYGLGMIADQGWVVVLPLLPALINFVLLYLFCGSQIFTSR